jgi:septal ring factor EnvC (AmiA/AmiB activator)
MRFSAASVLALTLTAASFPAFAQSSANSVDVPKPAITLPADGTSNSVDYTALREQLAQQNKSLQDQLNTQRAIVKKNTDLLKEAQKLDADNKKLEAERLKLTQQNADLEKQRAALKASQHSIETASVN